MRTSFLRPAVCFFVCVLAGFAAQGYSQAQAENALQIAKPRLKLVNLSSSEETRMIRENALGNAVSIKVMTENQNKFDRNHNGFLTGKELKRYLRKYNK